jgi:hypothetical protein
MTPECTLMKLSFTASRAKLEMKKEKEKSTNSPKQPTLKTNNNNNNNDSHNPGNHVQVKNNTNKSTMRVMENWKKVMQSPQRGELELRSQYF